MQLCWMGAAVCRCMSCGWSVPRTAARAAAAAATASCITLAPPAVRRRAPCWRAPHAPRLRLYSRARSSRDAEPRGSCIGTENVSIAVNIKHQNENPCKKCRGHGEPGHCCTATQTRRDNGALGLQPYVCPYKRQTYAENKYTTWFFTKTSSAEPESRS